MIKLPSRSALAAGLALALSSTMIAYAAETPSGAPNTTVVPDSDASKSPGAKEPSGKAKDSSAIPRQGRSRTAPKSSNDPSAMGTSSTASQVPDTDVSKSPGAKEPAGGTRY